MFTTVSLIFQFSFLSYFPPEDNVLANFLWGLANYGLYAVGGLVGVFGLAKFFWGFVSADPRKIGMGAIAMVGGIGFIGAKSIAKWAFEKWWDDQVEDEVYWGDESVKRMDLKPHMRRILMDGIPEDGVIAIEPDDDCIPDLTVTHVA